MNSSTKITLRSQAGTGTKNAFAKVPIIMRALFKLALINAYDEEGRIRNSKGEFIPNTNLVDLLVLSMTPKKDVYGIEEFIERLAEAQADPSWFLNEQVSRSLSDKLIKGVKPVDVPPVRPTALNPISSGAYWGPEKAKQRKLASFTKPPPLKLRPITDTPPSSPPSPFKKSLDYNFTPPSSPPSPYNKMGNVFSKPPELERMDVPPASPPKEMPALERIENVKHKRKRSDDVESVVDEAEGRPEQKRQRIDNKSADWMPLPPDDSDDDW